MLGFRLLKSVVALACVTPFSTSAAKRKATTCPIPPRLGLPCARWLVAPALSPLGPVIIDEARFARACPWFVNVWTPADS